MKQTKIKQIKGQSSLNLFFKSKNDLNNNVEKNNIENEETNENKLKCELENKDQKQQQDLSNINEENYNIIDTTKQINSNKLSHDDNQVEDPQISEIQNKLSPFKFSKKKTFKSKAKAKLEQNNQENIFEKKCYKDEYISLSTPFTNIITNQNLIEQKQCEEKIQSIQKSDGLNQTDLQDFKSESKKNMIISEFKSESLHSIQDSKNDGHSSNSRRNDSSKEQKTEPHIRRQLSLNDFRVFNQILNTNKIIKTQQENSYKIQKSNQIDIKQNQDLSNQKLNINDFENQVIENKEQPIHSNLNNLKLKDSEQFPQNTQINLQLNNQTNDYTNSDILNDSNKQIISQEIQDQQSNCVKEQQTQSNNRNQKKSKSIKISSVKQKKQNKQIEVSQQLIQEEEQPKQEQNTECNQENKNLDTLTKINEKNAQNMLKLFIQYLDNNVEHLSDDQKKNIAVLKKIKPITRQTYEQKLGELEFTEKYDNFISEYDQVMELKNQFTDFLECMKLQKKKKGEITKQINQILKQNQSSITEFKQKLTQDIEFYFSRFQKMQQINDNDKKPQKNEEEESKKMEPEMKGKDSYSIIQYVTQWDQNIEIRPTQEQLDVIVSDIKKDTKIIACAGSGKTTTLVLRLKYLLDHGVKPNSIIISTFNVEAGRHISQKVNEIIGKEAQQSILIGNIDKIAYKFIRGELEAKQKSSSSVLLFSQREYCDIWLAHIKKYKFQYLQYKYFFFDEFQDVSELQYEILMEFKKLNCILTVIGDDAQNIYGFRDTKIDIIQNRINEDLKKKKKDLQEFKLSANYRSTYEITMFANKIIEKNENLIQKKMESAQEKNRNKENQFNDMEQFEGNFPYLNIFDSEKSQNEVIIRRILSLVRNKGVQFKDIAIIGPMNEQLKKFEEVIEKHNQKSIERDQIPYQAYISLKFEDFKLVDYNVSTQRQNKLTISTIHRSKGLEWDYVYFIGCNDDQFPMAFVQKNKNQACTILEEQRRLFYVGSTRAIKELNFACIIKETEKMTEKDIKLGKYKVTRFFADIPREFFRYDMLLDLQQNLMTDYKWVEFEDPTQDGDDNSCEIKIKEVISQMTSKQLEDINLYSQNIIAEKCIKSLYMEKYEISQSVKDNQLFSEMGMFFDRCIIRMIGEKYDAENSFYNQIAAQVILPTLYELHLPENLFRLFLMYSKFFTYFDSAQLEDQNNLIQRFQNEGNREKSEKEISDMRELHNILSYNSEIQCLKRVQMFHFLKHKPNKYFQDQYERLGQSYIHALNEYMNRQKKSEDIYESIYKISKCGFLYENRRKYLYNDNLTSILDFELMSSIKVNFINGFLQQFEKLDCKKIYKTKHISGLIDIIADKNHLIFFKFDIFEQYKKEDFLNYLFAAAYLKVNSQINIELISVFNFLSGTIQQIDLRGWNQQQQFYDQIESIAKSQILSNIEKNILKIIDEEQDKILNRDQKDELKRILFSNLSPNQVQQNIENLKDQSSKNKHSPQLELQLNVSQQQVIEEDSPKISDNKNTDQRVTGKISQTIQSIGDNQTNIFQGQQFISKLNEISSVRKSINFEDQQDYPTEQFSQIKIKQSKENLHQMVQNFKFDEYENDDSDDNINNEIKTEQEKIQQNCKQYEMEVEIDLYSQQEKIIIDDQNKLHHNQLINEQHNQNLQKQELLTSKKYNPDTNNCFSLSSNLSSINNQIDIVKYLDLYQKYLDLKQELQQVKDVLEIDKKQIITKKQIKPKQNTNHSSINKNHPLVNIQTIQEKLLPDQIQERKEKFYKEMKSSTIKFDNQIQFKSQLTSPIQPSENRDQQQLIFNQQTINFEQYEDDISNVTSEEDDYQQEQLNLNNYNKCKRPNQNENVNKNKNNKIIMKNENNKEKIKYQESSGSIKNQKQKNNIQKQELIQANLNQNPFSTKNILNNNSVQKEDKSLIAQINQKEVDLSSKQFNQTVFNSAEEEDIQSDDEVSISFINKYRFLNNKQTLKNNL